jgi:hypothetical protein
MRAEWEPVWKPEQYESESKVAHWKRWEAAARADSKPIPTSSKPNDWYPTKAGFIAAIKKCKGAEGMDGWKASEVRLLLKVAPFIIDELYFVWCDTSSHAVSVKGGLDRGLLKEIFVWRVVGIPKKDENESRPISVASALVRCWLSALAVALPTAAENQYACKSGVSVSHAISAWLSVGATRGLEMDLSKAYDNVDHYVAVAALRAERAPEALISICLCAWKGPRVCCVQNKLSPPLWVVKGLSQGDSCAPGATVATLIPWRAEPAQEPRRGRPPPKRGGQPSRRRS